MEENRLRIFENEVFRKSEPKRGSNRKMERKLHNEELHSCTHKQYPVLFRLSNQGGSDRQDV
jgi:hypothetical protein